jgi:CO/xanthine dehydrogenase FAD-binding subunit
VEFLQPRSLKEALEVKADRPDAISLAGGTDLLVDMNFGRAHPETVMDLCRVLELTEHGRANGAIRIGAGVTYTRLIRELSDELPGLAIASRTVGSPQIRNRGTIGGNLGTASPAGDCHPVLLAAGSEVEVASISGTRMIPARDFFVGPKKNALEADELIVAVHVPSASAFQQFAKIGTRNAMVIAVASFAIEIDPVARRVGTGIGSAAPTPVTSPEAETFLVDVLGSQASWDTPAPIDPGDLQRFGELVSASASPIDDVRGTASYRKHALSVIAQRTLTWAWADYMGSA